MHSGQQRPELVRAHREDLLRAARLSRLAADARSAADGGRGRIRRGTATVLAALAHRLDPEVVVRPRAP